MTRTRHTNVKRIPPVDLNLDLPEQSALWKYYQSLTASGEAAAWIRDSLVSCLPPVVLQGVRREMESEGEHDAK